jgi:hypothetical protein
MESAADVSDTQSGVSVCEFQAGGPATCQKEAPRKPIGRPFQKGNNCGKGIRIANKRSVRAQYVLKIVRRCEWRKIIRSMVAIATDPKNRQAVAAAIWISDRIAGPVAQQVIIDDQASLSQEQRRIELLARVAEVFAPPADPAVDADSTSV